jgi:hypothetical protein
METINNEIKQIQTITKQEFIAMWKTASNDKRRKPIYKEEEIKVYNPNTRKYESKIHKVKVKGFLHPEHHILYNIVRGKPLSRGFIEHTVGYLTALSFFTSNYPNQYYSNLLYEPFKELITREKFDALIVEVQQIAKN